MPPQSNAEPYLSKSDIYEKFGRHPRTLTKDINKAIATQDTELLSLAQLRTKDSRVIPGTEVSPNTWKELSDNGENPGWYFLPDFHELVVLRTQRTRKGRPEPQSQKPSEATQKEIGGDPDQKSIPLPEDAEVRAIVLEQLHFNNLQHEQEKKNLTNRVLELVENNQELQKQTNTLIQKFQQLLPESVDRKAPKNSQALSTAKSDAQTLDAEIITSTPIEQAPLPKKEQMSTSSSRASTAKKTKRKKSSIKKKTKTPSTGFFATHLPTFFGSR